MKRFISFCMIAVALFIGVTSANMLRSESNSRINTSSENCASNQKSPSGDHQSFFSASDFLLTGSGNEQIRLSFSYQSASFRIIPFTHTFRVTHSSQIARLQYQTINSCFLLQSALKQSGGYYLFHLCKMLI